MKEQSLISLIERLNLSQRFDSLPLESDIGMLQIVEENSNGYLEYMSRREMRYAGNGKWEIFPGCFALWHTLGGSIYFWRDTYKGIQERLLRCYHEA